MKTILFFKWPLLFKKYFWIFFQNLARCSSFFFFWSEIVRHQFQGCNCLSYWFSAPSMFGFNCIHVLLFCLKPWQSPTMEQWGPLSRIIPNGRTAPDTLPPFGCRNSISFAQLTIPQLIQQLNSGVRLVILPPVYIRFRVRVLHSLTPPPSPFRIY